MATDENTETVVLDLPEPGDKRMIAPQVAFRLGSVLVDIQGETFHWRVIGQDESGDPVGQSLEVFSFSFSIDGRGFTVISGLAKSDLNQLGPVGARVAVS